MRKALIALAAAAASLALAAPPAGAHATLDSTSPERGAELAQPPAEVRFSFSEPVELSFGALRVFDAEGDEVQSGDPTHPGGNGDQIAVALPSDLPDGGYTATYRVVSADSHPVSGGFVFAVGDGSAAPAASVADLVDDPEAGAGTKIGFAAARTGSYAAIAVALGGAVFLLEVWGSALLRIGGPEPRWAEASSRFGARARLILGLAVGTGLVCTAAGIVFQGALASGTGPLDALDPTVVGDVLDTRFGTVWAIRMGIWAALAVTLPVAAARRGPALVGASGLLLAALAATPALAGHAGTLEPTAVLVPSTIVHVTAMSVWVGGLVMLVAGVPAATRSLEPPERTRLLAALLHRFSPIALGAVVILLASGTLQSLLELESLGALFDTTFGRLVLAKAALLAVLIGLGAWNRKHSIPRIDELAEGGDPPGGSGLALRRVLRAEVALVAGAIVAAAFLAAQTPNASSDGPASGSADLGDARLDYTVDPAQVGENEIHLYLTDPDTGAPFEARSAEARATATEQGIGPLELTLEKTGPGHFTIPAAALGVSGTWEIEVSSPVSRFEELRGVFEVEIQ